MGFLGRLLGTKQEDSSCLHVEHYRERTVYSPLKGMRVPLSKVDDPVFSQEIMGKGIAIVPEEGILYAPVWGTVEALFPTGHAIGLKSRDGMELLIHIGIDTVEMKGEGFYALVKQGDIVEVGTPLIRFDISRIKEQGFDPVTMVLLSNYQIFGEPVAELSGKVSPMDVLIHF